MQSGLRIGCSIKIYVEERIYDLLREEFSKDIYHEKVANATVPRWQHDIAWARAKAKKLHGYIKGAKESGHGMWELTLQGQNYYKELSDKLRQITAL